MPPEYDPLWMEITGILTPKSSFRVGTGEVLDPFSDMPVLRFENRHGRPWLPGSSLRGVLRAHLAREYSVLGVHHQVLENLFGFGGTQPRMGRIRVLDSIPDCDPAPSPELRDHVHIIPEWGAAADKMKFDVEVVPPVSTLQFPLRVVYEGPADEKSNNEELILLGEALRAFQTGLIRVGGRSGIGFGYFVLTTWTIRRFDRSTPEGISAWLRWRLGDESAGICAAIRFPPGQSAHVEPRSDLQPFHYLDFRITLRCEGPLLVKSPVRQDSPDAKPVKSAAGSYYLPGSSLRGVMRSHAFRIADSQNTGQEPVEHLFGCVKGDRSGRRGLLEVRDGKVSRAETVNSDHVAIDRITNAAANTAKFEDCALNSPKIEVALGLRFTDDPEDLAAVALLLLVIRDLLDPDRRRIWLGSQTTRGYGLVKQGVLEEVTGSFHGDRKEQIAANWNRKDVSVGRSDFAANTKELALGAFEEVCKSFEAAWTAVRGRSVPA